MIGTSWIVSLARIFSRAQVGVQAPEVIVEVHLGNGLPAFQDVFSYAFSKSLYNDLCI
ncbi:hypothetical protein ABMY47_15810 [Pseudoalteromonas sp. BZP1]|uniref:hypothetical protein n=1 Tax=unclassified Pseudoalteromonas TaxID=194690 RepID=UPI001F3E080A|nr:hypothetical protein [Pseudoalteromonas sp. PAST1]MCF2849177.1 hypothetical protein [Pseudoalteromonas sp. PAST1]